MDVNHRTFHNLLPSLLAAIADAHFVAIDLELSGIPGGQINKAKVPGSGSGSRTDGKPSLQERYEETKSAAEKYQVLQMGITCVGENRHRGIVFSIGQSNFSDKVQCLQASMSFDLTISFSILYQTKD